MRIEYLPDDIGTIREAIADSVNSLALTRDSWLEVARRAQVRAFEIEIICSDPDEHRSRVENRISDIPGLNLPSCQDVVSREYHPWDRDHVVIDTARRSIEENVQALRKSLAPLRNSPNT